MPNYLYETGGKLSMGDKAERVYGRKNFLELYAVFSSPVRYRVLTAQKQEIGTLEQSFVDSLVDHVTASYWGAGHGYQNTLITPIGRFVSYRPLAGEGPAGEGTYRSFSPSNCASRCARFLQTTVSIRISTRLWPLS